MKLQIKAKQENYEIEMQPITQLVGIDFKKKGYIINSLVKHFSASKYMEYENEMIDNIMLDTQQIGRKYFDVIHIRCREDMLNYLKLTKTSMLLKCVQNMLNSYDMQIELNVIEGALARIYEQLNLEIHDNISNISLSYDTEKIFDIVQQSKVKSDDGTELELLDNLKILNSILGLIEELQEQNPQKQMVVIENIDHMLDYSEYKCFYEGARLITEKRDVWFVLTTSLEGFVFIEEENICGINVINDMIYNIPPTERIVEFIRQQYPYYIEQDDDVLIEWMRLIIQKIGRYDIESDMRSNVVLKMINKSLCMSYKEKCSLNSMESSFLLH